MRSLAVALDETPASGSALDVAVALAGRFDAALTGLTVLDIDYLTAPQPTPIGGAYYKFKSDLARLEHAHEQAMRLRERFLALCAASKVRCAVGTLQSVIAELDPDLVVFGTHGRKGVARAFLGSVAETLLEVLTTDALVVRA